MLRFIQIFIYLTFATICYSQNNTLYLEKNQIILEGKEYNKLDSKGKKVGKWIEFEIDNSLIELTLGSGENAHFQEEIKFEYRPFNDGEFNGYKKLISEKVDTIEGDLFYDLKYLEIRNKIPSDEYIIEGKGNFKNGKKDGLWDYFYHSAVLKKTIIYKDGFPIKSFKINREDGSLMLDIIKIKDENWQVIKYSQDGKKLETITDKIENFKMLY